MATSKFKFPNWTLWKDDKTTAAEAKTSSGTRARIATWEKARRTNKGAENKMNKKAQNPNKIGMQNEMRKKEKKNNIFLYVCRAWKI